METIIVMSSNSLDTIREEEGLEVEVEVDEDERNN